MSRIDLKGHSDRAQRRELRKNPDLRNVVNKTPEEAAQWIDDNVTDLASAKQALKVIARILVIAAKQVR